MTTTERQKSGDLTVNPDAFGITGRDTELNYRVEQIDTERYVFSHAEMCLLVRASSEFISPMFDWLVDVFLSKILTSSQSDVMLLRQNGPATVLLAEITRHGDREWVANLTEHERVDDLEDSFTLSAGVEQRHAVEQSFTRYCEWARPADPAARVGAEAKGQLIVKVDPSELWFLKFPIAMFCHLGLGAFSRYETVQTIVTDRTVTQVCAMSRKVETELTSVETFLNGVYVVINTYEAHLKSFAELRDYTELVIEIMKALSDLAFSTGRLTLRWSLNPGIDELREILLSSTTRFVFANFEADEGTWELGDGPHDCWRCLTQTCDQHVDPHQGRDFSLLDLAGQLGHLSLLRVFHCNSIYDPYKASCPADAGTIARDLLLTEAWFVEGSFTKERYVDHICSLLRLLLGRSDLQAILKAKSRIKKADFYTWVDRANDILKVRNYQLISH